MKAKIILCLAAMALCLAASAQDLKPVKDKQTKKYGYQDKQKNWVIPPVYDGAKRFGDDGYALVKMADLYGLIDMKGNWILQPEYDDIGKFDKNGLCKLKIKDGRGKFFGLADMSGKIVLPVQYHAIEIPRNGGCIKASQEVNTPEYSGSPVWGVYDMGGNVVFEPQFLSEPSYADGNLIAKGASGLFGVVDMNGRTLLPFEYLAIARNGSGFRALGRNFSQINFTASLTRAETLVVPGSVIPYDPMGDIVRAAAWHSGCIGARLHPNQVRVIEMQSGYGMSRVYCQELRLDWGRGRFLRLEPFVVDGKSPNAMADGDRGRYYTLKAVLYEADGTLVREITANGCLEAECADGVIYNAGGRESWLILPNPNSLGLPSYSLTLSGYRTLTHSTIYEGLGIRSTDLSRLGNVWNYARRYKEIIEDENLGVTSYTPQGLSLSDGKRAREAMRAEVFHHPFRMGDVVNCKVRQKGEDVDLELSEQLVCHFEDRFSDPYYSMSGDEVIYWGPHNDRTVHLSLEPTYSKDAMADDYAGNGKFWTIVLSLYEEDGTWLRTLAKAPYADYAQNGVLVFRGLGIALLAPGAPKPRPGSTRVLKLAHPLPLPHALSALESFSMRPPGGGHPR